MNTILFDLDGTLLPMNQDDFINAYFNGVSKTLMPYGIEPEALMSMVIKGTKAMLGNDGTVYNDRRFWDKATNALGEKVRGFEEIFLNYYKKDFQDLKVHTKASPLVKECIYLLKKKGYRLVLATNPLFPSIATHSRIYWAGLEPEDFELITTYDNSSYCKPNINYYMEILNKIEVSKEECIMVGNDVSDDMVVQNIGMDTYLVTDCLINVENKDIGGYKNGTFEDFYDYVKTLPSLVTD